ncbi:MAG: efflux RND transporter periplasmic adaptor subunit [Acidobacteriota bacterium]
MKGRPPPVLSLWLWLALMASAVGCDAPSENPGSTLADNTPVEPPPVNVSVVKIEPSGLTEKVILAGRLEPWVEVRVSTELGGTVQDVDFDEGQRVKKGQALARVGTDLLTATFEEAEAELIGAQANFEKTKELFARQALPRQELVAATSRYEMAKARVALARLRVERSIIKAPITGVAIERAIEPGEVLPPGARITTVHQVSRLKAHVGIPENDIAFFHTGGEASVEVDAYPNRTFEGRIHFLSPAATGGNRTFPTDVAIFNHGGKLRPGMIARVALVRRRYENAVVVPRDALLERDQGSVAFVLEKDRAWLRPVKLGPGEGNRVVVLEGLSAGEWLIVTGQRNLVDGHPVRVVD